MPLVEVYRCMGRAPEENRLIFQAIHDASGAASSAFELDA